MCLFLIGASVTKCWVKSHIFRYGLPKGFLSKGQKDYWPQTDRHADRLTKWFSVLHFELKRRKINRKRVNCGNNVGYLCNITVHYLVSDGYLFMKR